MNLSDYKEQFNKVIDFLKKELGGIKTGRASAALVENVEVEAYGSKMPLKGTASIAIPDAKTIYIEPWDKTLAKAIEKAISESGVGLNPVSDGKGLRIVLPQLTEERRKDLIKVMKEKLEEAKMGIRRVRDEVKSKIVAEEKDGKISEDEKYRLQEELDKVSADFNEQIKKIGEEKEKEIMTI
jgi:ribosome recycling factor